MKLLQEFETAPSADRQASVLAEAQKKLPQWYAALDVAPPDVHKSGWLKLAVYDLMPDDAFQAAAFTLRQSMERMDSHLPVNLTRRELSDAAQAFSEAVRPPSTRPVQPASAPASAPADPPAAAAGVDSAAKDAANDFWRAFAMGEFQTAAKSYAPKVTILAGSQWLSDPRLGLFDDSDTTKDRDVDGDKLLGVYRKLFDSVGKDRWAATIAKFGPGHVTLWRAETTDKSAGLQKDDVVLTVTKPSGGSSSLTAMKLVFRKSPAGKWQVVAEYMDF